MINTKAEESQDSDWEVSDLSSEEFQDLDEYSNEEDELDDDEKRYKNFKVVMDDLTYKQPVSGHLYDIETNKMSDLKEVWFSKAADEFMHACGEDNIFMSGIDWLIDY